MVGRFRHRVLWGWRLVNVGVLFRGRSQTIQWVPKPSNITFSITDVNSFAAIGRTLIPRYFRSIFEGGVTELYYNMKHPKESFHNTSITLDCDQCTMVTHHGKPLFTKVSVINFSSCTTLGLIWTKFPGVYRRPINFRIYFWRPDEDKVVAFRGANAPGVDPAFRGRDARATGSRDTRSAYQEHYEAGHYKFYS